VTREDLQRRIIEALGTRDASDLCTLVLDMLPLANIALERRERDLSRKTTRRKVSAVSADSADTPTPRSTDDVPRNPRTDALSAESADNAPSPLPSPLPLSSPSSFSPTPPLTTPSPFPLPSPAPRINGGDVAAREANGDGEGVTANAEPIGLEAKFTDPDQRQAYLGYRRAHPFPPSFDASIRTVVEPIAGGTAYGWDVVGAALLELRAAGGTFSPVALRAFAARVATGGEGPGGASTPGSGGSGPPRRPDVNTEAGRIFLERRKRERTAANAAERTATDGVNRP